MAAFSLHSGAAERRLCRIELSRISPSPYQPRRSFDEAELRTLADSISRYGLLSPLLVRKIGVSYELIAGERRLRALELLGWSHAEAFVSVPTDEDCALIGLIENLQREDLHFLDEAEACHRILQERRLSREELASVLGKSTSALANLLRVLRLSRSVKSCIREYGLSERHARALLQIKDENQQLELARRAAREQLSVRQLEALIDVSLRGKKAPSAKPLSGLMQDSRLVVNALKDTVRQLKRIGVPASYRVETRKDAYDVIITVKLPPNPQ